jgi:hypothetical protein
MGSNVKPRIAKYVIWQNVIWQQVDDCVYCLHPTYGSECEASYVVRKGKPLHTGRVRERT